MPLLVWPVRKMEGWRDVPPPLLRWAAMEGWREITPPRSWLPHAKDGGMEGYCNAPPTLARAQDGGMEGYCNAPPRLARAKDGGMEGRSTPLLRGATRKDGGMEGDCNAPPPLGRAKRWRDGRRLPLCFGMRNRSKDGGKLQSPSHRGPRVGGWRDIETSLPLLIRV